MGFLDDGARREVREALGELPGAATLTLFTRAHDCPTCEDLRQLLDEVAGTHPSIRLEVLDADTARERAAALGIEQTPALAVMGAEDRGVRFLGTPAGYEFGTLLAAIRSVSAGESTLGPELRATLAALARPVNIKVFVTPSCPYCPPAVTLAHQIALATPGVRAEMVESLEFPELSDRYGVQGVPRIVIDDRIAIEGAIPPRRFVEAVLEAAAR